MTETPVSSPGTSSTCSVNGAPSFSWTGPFAKVLMRYSGPLVSSMMAMGRFSCSRTRTMVSIFFLCSGWVPWEKLMRAMFMPALHMAVKTASDSLAGPMVQMILVFLIGSPRWMDGWGKY